MNREDLDRAIRAYMAELSDDDADKDEYWVTPHQMAEQVLTAFLDFTAPHPMDDFIEELEAKLATLKAERASR